jgi:hypothetical protein
MLKCSAIGSYAQNKELWAHVWAKNGPKTARTATESRLARPKQEVMSKTQNTPWLARNAPFAHLGACRGRQSVVLSVHMLKPGTLGAYLGENGPKTARIATKLAGPNFN